MRKTIQDYVAAGAGTRKQLWIEQRQGSWEEQVVTRLLRALNLGNYQNKLRYAQKLRTGDPRLSLAAFYDLAPSFPARLIAYSTPGIARMTLSQAMKADFWTAGHIGKALVMAEEMYGNCATYGAVVPFGPARPVVIYVSPYSVRPIGAGGQRLIGGDGHYTTMELLDTFLKSLAESWAPEVTELELPRGATDEQLDGRYE